MEQTGLLQREVKIIIHRKCNNQLMAVDGTDSLYCPSCRHLVDYIEQVKVQKFLNPVQLVFPNRTAEIEQLPPGHGATWHYRKFDPRFYEGPRD